MNASADSSSSSPRLGMGHLLLWTFCCGVTVSLASGLENWQSLEQSTRLALRIYYMVVGIAYGATLAALFVFVRRGYARTAILTHPGHHLLLLGVAVMIIDFGVTAWMRFDSNGEVNLSNQVGEKAYCLHHVMLHGGAGLAIFLMLITGMGAPGWRTVLVAPLLFCITSVAWHAAYLVDWTPAYVGVNHWWWSVPTYSALVGWGLTVVALTLTAYFDARKRGGRDWMHWTGLGLWVALAVLQLVTRTGILKTGG